MHPKPDTEAFVLRAIARDKSGRSAPYRWNDADTVALPDVKGVPAAIESLDVNADRLADLIIFNDYGPPQLLLGKKGGPPQPFAAGRAP